MTKPHLTIAADNEAPSRLLAPASEARLALARLINDRLAIERRLVHLDEAAKRLRETQAAEQRAIAELNALDASESAAMAAWSRDPESSEPEPDLAKREALESTLRSAAAKANAARQAEAAIHADIGREHAALTALKAPMHHAVAAVVAEEALAAPLAELRQAVQAAMLKQERVRQAVSAIFEIAGRGPVDEMRPTFKLAEQLDDDLRKAAAPPTPDGSPPFQAWMKLVEDLQRDPLAELQA